MEINSLEPGETIVVVGASFSGIEIATELRSRVGKDKRIILLEQGKVAGAALGDNLSPFIQDALAQANIEVTTGKTIQSFSGRHILLDDGEEIVSSTIVLATGLQASSLTKCLAGGKDAVDGRVSLDPVLRVKGYKKVFGAGDVGRAMASPEHATLMSCQHAMPMGQVAGRNAVLDSLGQELIPYSQEFYATCLDLGSWGAAFTTGWDRQIAKIGQEGKKMKMEINQQWIYPPDPANGRDAIFKAVRDAN